MELLLRDGKMFHNELRRNMNKDFANSLRPYHPSDTHFQKNVDDLKEWLLIEDDDGFLSITEIGEFCFKNSIDPTLYTKSILLCIIIIFRVFQGVWKDKDGKDPLKNVEKTNYYYEQRGVTPEEMFSHRSRIFPDHLDINKMNTTLSELEKYFDFLARKKILAIVEDDSQRYILIGDYKVAISLLFIILFKLFQVLDIKWNFITRPTPAEIEWYESMYGNTLMKLYTTGCAEKLNKNKNRLEVIKYKKKEVVRHSNEIIDTLSEVRAKFQSRLTEIQGFIDFAIELVCPKNLEKEINTKAKMYSAMR
jgi:hypothetical protein